MSGQTAGQLSTAPGRHIGEIFFHRVAELGDRTFLKLQCADGFKEVSWQEFGALVQNLLLALYALGLQPGEPIAIVGENSLEWLCADLATLTGGFPNVVIAPAVSDGMLTKILNHSGCRAAFVQDAIGAKRLLNLRPQLPALSHVWMMEGGDPSLPGTTRVRDLIQTGKSSHPDRLREVLDSVRSTDLATIMYTSGSTGDPKGVMRTQENLLANITNGGPLVVSKPDEMTVIVLSLNHLFGRFGFLKSAVTGRTTAVIEATELNLDLNVLKSLAATAMAMVPRVMGRIWNGILQSGDTERLWLELEALDGKKSHDTLDSRGRDRFDELRAVLKERFSAALGGRIKYIAYAGAAMPPRIMRCFELLGIPLIGSYGSTECGGVTLCGIGENRPGNLGKPFPNIELRIAEDSEILVRGPTVSPGYFNNPEATREAFDIEGWFHTGDLGALDRDGSLTIVGRKKDVFNCSDGSNIYPAFIELQLENEPFIRQAILLGDRRPFIAALIVADRPKISEQLDIEASSLTGEQVEKSIWTQIEHVNARLEHYEKICKFALIENNFPPEVRTINVFQKVKVDRQAVAIRYRETIDKIYQA